MNAETANRRVDLGNSVISLVFGLLAALVFTSTTGAASFDCSKARAPDERAICEDRELNDQDVRVAVLYQTTSHFLAMGARDEARAQQARWLAEAPAVRRQSGLPQPSLRAAASRTGANHGQGLRSRPFVTLSSTTTHCGFSIFCNMG